MNSNPLLKYLVKESKEDVVHSSAYAKVQNEGSFGVASTQSFDERQKIDANRQIVQNYNKSKLIQQTRMNAPRAKVYVKPAEPMAGGSANLNNVAQNRAMMPRRNPGIVKK